VNTTVIRCIGGILRAVPLVRRRAEARLQQLIQKPFGHLRGEIVELVGSGFGAHSGQLRRAIAPQRTR
jgi:hypothetical protein